MTVDTDIMVIKKDLGKKLYRKKTFYTLVIEQEVLAKDKAEADVIQNVIENIDDGLLTNAKDMLNQLKEVELEVVEYSKVDNTQYKINDKLEKRIKTLEQKVGI